MRGRGERLEEAALAAARDAARIRTSRIATLAIVGGAVVVLFVVGWLTTPQFLQWPNLRNVVRSAAMIGMIALGMTFITLSGNFFSLSVAQTGAFSAIAFAFMMSWGWPLPLALLAVLAGALLVGAAQGGLVALGGNPIVVTLGVGAGLFGLGSVLTDNKTIRHGNTAADWMGTGRPLGIPTQTWAFIILCIIAAIVLSRTRFGRNVLFVGGNKFAAASSGIRPSRVAIQVFAISAFAASIAGLFLSAQFGEGRLDSFTGDDINAIAAILVGGAALQGGEGSPLRTALGAVFIAALENLMVLRQYAFGVRKLWVGVAILVAVSLFNYLRSRARTT
ncbi:MAG: ABC transporter permease [Actinobacteria bacterium]|nr:ABC transporter permease [Actinomycetota bacterium]